MTIVGILVGLARVWAWWCGDDGRSRGWVHGLGWLGMLDSSDAYGVQSDKFTLRLWFGLTRGWRLETALDTEVSTSGIAEFFGWLTAGPAVYADSRFGGNERRYDLSCWRCLQVPSGLPGGLRVCLEAKMELIGARALNAVTHCERLFWLVHVLGDFEDNHHTIEGRAVHRQVDAPTKLRLPEPELQEEAPEAVRRVHLSDLALGLVAIIDLVEAKNGGLVPIDYKKGALPPEAIGIWAPDQVQVCAQALLLRAHGYEVPHGVLYYAGSKRRVELELDDALVARTLGAVDRARAILESKEPPPPLVQSPKCAGCSMVGICMPDETLALSQGLALPERDLVPARDDKQPLHLQLRGGRAGLDGGEILVKDREGVTVARQLGDDNYFCVATTTTSARSLTASTTSRYTFAVTGGGEPKLKTDLEVRKVMSKLGEGRTLTGAARAADMSANTARRYRDAGKLPSEMKSPRVWRTREDPFEEADWAWSVARLSSPEGAKLESKALFRAMRTRPDVVGTYTPGQLRSFQRKVRRWRASEGGEKEVFFPQRHVPGEALQTDWTHGSDLRVTLAGEAFPHLLCHTTLPFSNWRSARVCRSESLASLKDGVQAALRKLMRRPEFHQTDQSSAATHAKGGGREFNQTYADFIGHHGMKPRTIGVKKPNQNGDVEAGNGALVRAIGQALLLRASRDFADQAAYQTFVDGVVNEMNEDKAAKLTFELEVMASVTSAWAPTWKAVKARVGSQSSIRVLYNAYSVPSRLIGETIEARVYDAVVEVWFGSRHELTTERLPGRYRARIDYRHVVWSLRRKPGAFQRYRHREEMFPRPVFRRAYDAIVADGASTRRDAMYLDILHLAASTVEEDVGSALELLLDAGAVPTRDAVAELVGERRHTAPAMAPYDVDISHYDTLLDQVMG